MIKNRWLIPASLAAFCMLLAIVAKVAHETEVIQVHREVYAVGEVRTFSGLALDPDKTYRLELGLASEQPVGSSATVSASLLRGDAVVFELEDAYWHERGTWREGSESGTWQEANRVSSFMFKVPEAGAYDLEVSVPATSDGGRVYLGSRVVLDIPFPLSPLPLVFGGLFLFGLAAVSRLKAPAIYAQMLADMGPGSRVIVNDTEYTVVERSEHWDGHERSGAEFRIRDANGATRWLEIDRFERTNPWNSEEDQLISQILINVRLTDAQLEALAKLPPRSGAAPVGAETYFKDADNSGTGTVATIRNGETYTSSYFAWVYRPSGPVPNNPGERWLTLTEWRGSEAEDEWSLMEIVDWQRVEVIEFVPAEKVEASDLRRGNRPADPFGDSVGAPAPRPVTRATASRTIDTDWAPSSDRAESDDESQNVTQANHQAPFDSNGKG